MKKRRIRNLSNKPDYLSQGVQTLITFEDIELLILGKKPLKTLLVSTPSSSNELEINKHTNRESDRNQHLEAEPHLDSSLSRSNENCCFNECDTKSELKHSFIHINYEQNPPDGKLFQTSLRRSSRKSRPSTSPIRRPIVEMDVKENSNFQRVVCAKKCQRETYSQSLKNDSHCDSIIKNKRTVEEPCHLSVKKNKNVRFISSRKKKTQISGQSNEVCVNVTDFKENSSDNLDKHKIVQQLDVDDTYKQFTCSYCSKMFSCKKNLRTHLWIHEKVKDFTCENCGKKFLRANELCLHNRTHSGEKPYSCKICEKAFKSSSALKRHQIVHKEGHKDASTVTSGHGCTICGKTFSQKGNLTVHLKIHTGTYDHKCSHCPKSFITSGDLKRHLRVHSKEKPYTCHTCSKSFTTSSSLVCHMRLHSGDRPYLCGVCGTSFSVLSHLKQHNKIHARGDLLPRKRKKAVTKDYPSTEKNLPQNEDCVDQTASVAPTLYIGSTCAENLLAKEITPLESAENANFQFSDNTIVDCRDLDVNNSVSSVTIINAGRNAQLLDSNNVPLSPHVEVIIPSGDTQGAISETQSHTHLSVSGTPENIPSASNNQPLILSMDITAQADVCVDRTDNCFAVPISAASSQNNTYLMANTDLSQAFWNLPVTNSSSKVHPVLSTNEQIIYAKPHAGSEGEKQKAHSSVSAKFQYIDSKVLEEVYGDTVSVTSNQDNGKTDIVQSANEKSSFSRIQFDSSLTQSTSGIGNSADFTPNICGAFSSPKHSDSFNTCSVMTTVSETGPHISNSKMSFSVSSIIGTVTSAESWKPNLPNSSIGAGGYSVINAVYSPLSQSVNSNYLNSASNCSLASSNSFSETRIHPSHSLSNVQNNTVVFDTFTHVNSSSSLMPQNVQSSCFGTDGNVSKLSGENTVKPMAPLNVAGPINVISSQSSGCSVFNMSTTCISQIRESYNYPITSRRMTTGVYSNVCNNLQTVGTLTSPIPPTKLAFTKSFGDVQTNPSKDSLGVVSLNPSNLCSGDLVLPYSIQSITQTSTSSNNQHPN